MKNCIQCGAEADDWETTCKDCGRDFSFVSKNQSQQTPSEAGGTDLRERPDGANLKLLGGMLALVAFVAFIWGFFMESTSYQNAGSDLERIALKADLVLLGTTGVQIGVMVWLAGIIVNAISFLPTKE